MPAPKPPQPVPPRPATARCVLAFDTSTEQLAIGLAAGGAAFTASAEGGAAASAALLPSVHRLLAEAGIALRDLDAIAFGRGPGAFTGLRTACAVAQGLGYGLARPLLPLDSLLIVAEDARAQRAAELTPGEREAPFELAVAMDARMGEVYAGRYRWHAGRWTVLHPPALLSLPALAETWAAAPPPVVAGSALDAFGTALALRVGCIRLPREADRAAALLRLALAAAAAGEGVDAARALPLYLRDKVALTTREREAARAAGAAPA